MYLHIVHTPFLQRMSAAGRSTSRTVQHGSRVHAMPGWTPTLRRQVAGFFFIDADVAFVSGDFFMQHSCPIFFCIFYYCIAHTLFTIKVQSHYGGGGVE